MKKILSILIILTILFFLTGIPRTDVYLKDFAIDNDIITLKVGVTDSSGYIRKMKKTSSSMDFYFTFYKTFGINNKIGAQDSFKVMLDNNVSAIYFYIGKQGYKKVLEKDKDGNWLKV